MSDLARYEIIPAAGPEDLAEVRDLWEEYWKSFGFTPCFQNFSEELAGLPGRYVPPDGRLALAWASGQAAGCIALRRLDDARGEVKRLYVRPSYRGLGLGHALLQWIIQEARSAGYCELLGDTMPVMSEAMALYERVGFERIAAYAGQETSGAIPIRLRL